MNESTWHHDGSPTFAIKLEKVAGGYKAHIPYMPELKPVEALTERAAANGIRARLDEHILKHPPLQGTK